MPEPTPSQRRHLLTRKGELEAKYERLSRYIAALDVDIGLELDSLRKLTLEERRAGLVAERDALVAELEGVERQLVEAPPTGASSSGGSPAAPGLRADPSARRPSVLYDESHGQDAWFGAAPTIAKGFRTTVAALRQTMDVASRPAAGPITLQELAAHDAFVLSLGPQAKTQLSADELQAIHGFVRDGGGLLVLGAYTGDWHHQGNLNQLLAEYGMAFNRDVVMPAGARGDDGKLQGTDRSPASRYAVEAWPVQGAESVRPEPAEALLAGVSSALTLSSCSLYVDDDLATGLLESDPNSVVLEPVPIGVTIYIQEYRQAGRGPAVLLAASKTAKVAVAGSWKMFLDAFVDDPRFANGRLFQNLVGWLTA